ncbi:MAG: membrane protein insertion efficiency factor YidD [Candidatus Marinimicrobia bacterium]|nr:membrane protein insertion efficiency factor YidD [Candidatus Neomarinimicrobiota bacterium]
MEKTFAIVLILIFTNIFAQSKYPADTLLVSKESSFVEKTVVAPIALWQRLSYNVPFLKCQFYPSCSNFAAQSISQHGVVKGSIIAADRIVRCNPAAFHYHIRDRNPDIPASENFYVDGRLIDHVPNPPAGPVEFQRGTLFHRAGGQSKSSRSPILAAGLSAIIPGAGRIYAGRTWDGLFGFLTFALVLNTTYLNYQNGNRVSTTVLGIGTGIFYLGEIYGAYRSALISHPENK